jgi:hypothetical protein
MKLISGLDRRESKALRDTGRPGAVDESENGAMKTGKDGRNIVGWAVKLGGINNSRDNVGVVKNGLRFIERPACVASNGNKSR